MRGLESHIPSSSSLQNQQLTGMNQNITNSIHLNAEVLLSSSKLLFDSGYSAQNDFLVAMVAPEYNTGFD
jgi:hypothetical protein